MSQCVRARVSFVVCRHVGARLCVRILLHYFVADAREAFGGATNVELFRQCDGLCVRARSAASVERKRRSESKLFNIKRDRSIEFLCF